MSAPAVISAASMRSARSSPAVMAAAGESPVAVAACWRAAAPGELPAGLLPPGPHRGGGAHHLRRAARGVAMTRSRQGWLIEDAPVTGWATARRKRPRGGQRGRAWEKVPRSHAHALDRVPDAPDDLARSDRRARFRPRPRSLGSPERRGSAAGRSKPFSAPRLLGSPPFVARFFVNLPLARVATVRGERRPSDAHLLRRPGGEDARLHDHSSPLVPSGQDGTGPCA